jgi:hypothetical protein
LLDPMQLGFVYYLVFPPSVGTTTLLAGRTLHRRRTGRSGGCNFKPPPAFAVD